MKGKKFLKITLSSIAILLLLAAFTLTTVDWSPLEEQDYYHQTFNRLDSLELTSEQNEYWLAGWGKSNYTPQAAATLVGYKPRGHYEFVQDSSFVKTIIISNGKTTLAFINYELLIVHPYLANNIQTSIKKSGIPIDHIYFTATHTHSGMGGYIPGLMGKIAFGGYDPEIVSLLESKTLSALQNALATLDTATITYKRTITEGLISNRFVENDPVDAFIRQLIIQKDNGQKANLMTFAGHPTILSSKFMGLSGDFPHYLTKELEEDDFDFVLFAAGAVGSQRADAGGNEIQHAISYAAKLKEVIKADTSQVAVSAKDFIFHRVNIDLRDAHYRISDNIRLRPWVFNALFGDANVHLDLLKIGNVLMVGSSAELSGVFMADWEKLAQEKGLHFLLTSFNGGYMGYVTPDAYYNYHYHEVRDMNFYGPYNGQYYKELISKSILKIAD
jgi:hypothetical protein